MNDAYGAYTTESCLAGGNQHLAFQTKPQIASTLLERAQTADVAFKAIVTNCLLAQTDAAAKHYTAHLGKLASCRPSVAEMH